MKNVRKKNQKKNVTTMFILEKKLQRKSVDRKEEKKYQFPRLINEYHFIVTL